MLDGLLDEYLKQQLCFYKNPFNFVIEIQVKDLPYHVELPHKEFVFLKGTVYIFLKQKYENIHSGGNTLDCDVCILLNQLQFYSLYSNHTS